MYYNSANSKCLLGHNDSHYRDNSLFFPHWLETDGGGNPWAAVSHRSRWLSHCSYFTPYGGGLVADKQTSNFCRLTVCGLKWLTLPKVLPYVLLQQPWVQPGTPSLFLPTESTSSLTPKKRIGVDGCGQVPAKQPTRSNLLSDFIAQEFWTVEIIINLFTSYESISELS